MWDVRKYQRGTVLLQAGQWITACATETVYEETGTGDTEFYITNITSYIEMKPDWTVTRD